MLTALAALCKVLEQCPKGRRYIVAILVLIVSMLLASVARHQ